MGRNGKGRDHSKSEMVGAARFELTTSCSQRGQLTHNLLILKCNFVAKVAPVGKVLDFKGYKGKHLHMAKPARFTPKQTPHGWRINIPPKFSESGKRNRFHYPSKNAALDAAK